MSAALVASNAAASTNGNSLSGVASINSTGANFIAVACSYFVGTTFGLSDSKGNTPTFLTARTADVGVIQLAYFVNPTVGSGHTFDTSGNGLPAIAVLAFSGMKTVSPFDTVTGESTDRSFATTVQPGSLTPSEDNEVIITGCNSNLETSNTINGGFSSPVQAGFDSGNSFYVGISFLIQTAAAAANPTWTGTFAGGKAAAMACFKSALVVGGGPLIYGGSLTKGPLIRNGRLVS